MFYSFLVKGQGLLFQINAYGNRIHFSDDDIKLKTIPVM